MGMIWNSPATMDMIRQVNLEFSGDSTMDASDAPKRVVPPIAYWQAQREALFNSTARKHLKDIASDNSVTSPTQNGHWMEWLTKLGSHSNGNSPHEKLRAAIYKGLDATKYTEIVFSIIPTARGQKVKVSSEAVGAAFVILVETPPYDTVDASIRRRKKSIADKKDKKDKKKT